MKRPAGQLSAAGLAALLAVLASVLAAAVGHTWVTAQARAVMVLSTALELPVASETVELLTGEPRVEERPVAGVSTVVFKPAGEGPHPTLVFVNGAVPLGPEEPAVTNLSGGLARAGYRVLVPDLPGLREGSITEQTAAATTEVALAAAGDPGTRDGRVGLFGVSVGASLAILAAGEPELGERTAVVSGLAPYADLENVVRLATTDTYMDPLRDPAGPFEYHPRQYLGLVVARSLAEELPGEDRDRMVSELPPVEEYQPPGGQPPDEPEPDPLDAVRDLSPEDFGPEARSLIRLLSNRDPERFDDLYGELSPELQENIEELSPVAGAEGIP
ncbi:MAG: alpha/beta fold hydrolase, partial [Rubrobacter sp.]|nr:alpha/beta fold hydrolase [Rubrobacter sp.]